MFCISLHFKKAHLDIREKVSLPQNLLKSMESGVLLDTCNRLELYGTGDMYSLIDSYFAPVKDYLFRYEGKKAVQHLFRVAAGLDSMMIGENEILGQVKDAFASSLEHGCTGYELNTIFKAAITCAKQIKTDTLLSKSSISIANLAVGLCNHYKKEKKKVLVIGGSGEIGSKVIRKLMANGNYEIYATVRERHIKEAVHPVAYADRYQYLEQADIVVSATKSPHFTIVKDKIDDKKRLYIDLAVPRDIDPAIGDVVTMDSLRELAERNNDIKQGEIERAEAIIEEQMESLAKDMALHSIMPLPDDDSIKHLIYTMRDTATAREFSAFCAAMARMEGKQ